MSVTPPTPPRDEAPEAEPTTPEVSDTPVQEDPVPSSDTPVAPEDERTAKPEPAKEAAAIDESAAADEAAAAEVSDVVDASDVADEAVAAQDSDVAGESVATQESRVAEESVVTEDGAATEDAHAVEDLPAEAQVPVDPSEPASGAAPTPRPVPRPTPASVRPGPRPMPRPPLPRPAASAETVVVAPPVDAAEAARAATFGRVEADGTVVVVQAAGERVVGQYAGADLSEAMDLYVRRFLDLQAKVALFETRLQTADLPVKEIDSTLERLTQEAAEPAAVGDLDGLAARLEALSVVAAERRAAAEAERAAARRVAIEQRTAMVEEAERIAATDIAKIQWRPAGEQLRVLLDSWKEAQRSGPRIDRPTEDALWKRFSHARTTFDRERRHYFAELEQRNTEAKSAKERLVEQAQALATSTDWGATASAYRELMTQWKSAGRASRSVDDALWGRFRAAQDAFFASRDAANAATDAEYGANLEVKLRLLAEAEALLPVRNLAAAKQTLRSVQERWEAAGKVPRGDVQRVEGRLRAVETAVREAEDAQWRRSNPETRARAEGAAAQLEAAISGLEADLAAATAKGDARKVKEATAALEARRSWLEQVRRAADDSRG